MPRAGLRDQQSPDPWLTGLLLCRARRVKGFPQTVLLPRPQPTCTITFLGRFVLTQVTKRHRTKGFLPSFTPHNVIVV